MATPTSARRCERSPAGPRRRHRARALVPLVCALALGGCLYKGRVVGLGDLLCGEQDYVCRWCHDSFQANPNTLPCSDPYDPDVVCQEAPGLADSAACAYGERCRLPANVSSPLCTSLITFVGNRPLLPKDIADPAATVFGADPAAAGVVAAAPTASARMPLSPQAAGSIVELPALTLPTIPSGIAARPDGRLWVALASSGRMLLLDPDGPDLTFELDTWDANPMDVALAPDGSVWFAQSGLDEIGRLQPAGGPDGLEFDLAHYGLDADSRPMGVAVDVDGSLWFTRHGDGTIGKAPPGIGEVLALPLPGEEGSPLGIARGADGNFWFTDQGAIGRIAAATGAVTEFPLPADAIALWITAGPDGALWFTDAGRNRIGRITTAGVLSDYPLPTAHAVPFDIVAGPDGNLWFTELDAGRIGRITPAGVVNEFPLAAAAAGPTFLTVGSDGALWFSESAARKVGRITTAGAVSEIGLDPTPSSPRGLAVGADGALWFLDARKSRVARLDADGMVGEQVIPSRQHGRMAEPNDLALGPDGNLWFTDGVGQIGRVTPAGVVDMFEVPLPAGGGLLPGPYAITAGPDAHLYFTVFFVANENGRLGRIATDGTIELIEFPIDQLGTVRPTGIVTAPDGNLWMVDNANRRLLRMTPAREFTFFQLDLEANIPDLVVGPDGNLWYTDRGRNLIGRMTLAGVETTFAIPTQFARPAGIAVGPDGNLWFTETDGNRLGRITPAGVITEYEVPTEDAQPAHIAAGPDGAMWFAEGRVGQLGRLATPGVGTCAASSTTLCVDDAPGDRRFAVEVEYETTLGGGLAGSASAIPLSSIGIDKGGVFYFSNPANPEMLAKVLNACAINGRYWVFLSAGTNFGLTTTVTDTITGSVKEYTNPDRTAAVPVQDVRAFPCDEAAAALVPSEASVPRAVRTAVLAASPAAPAATAAACTPSATRLCVDHLPGDGRFAVEVAYETTLGGGTAGDAGALPLASLGVASGGVFYFADAGNPEMLLKVLDGCGFNDRFWVFYSAGTNLGLTTTVTDTVTGFSKQYTNPDRTPAPPIQDTNFMPCP
jgi:streptogramin lyase